MRSPLEIWEPEIRAAPFASAPGKKERLAKLIDARGVTLDFVDDGGMHFRAYSDRPEIQVGWPALEALWCATYAYIAAYQTRVDSQRSIGPRFYVGSRELSFGKDLYGWSINRLRGNSVPQWPVGLPLPTRPPPTDFDQLVLEVFLVAVAWILHHELGHQLLQRPTPTGRAQIELECEADHHATGWLLDGVDDKDVATKMATGICIATGFLEACRENLPSETHPSPLDRLKTALSYSPLPDDGLAYAIALSVLQLNWFLREHKTWIQLEDMSFRELFEQFGECISGRATSTWLSVRPEDAAKADLALSAPLNPQDTRLIAYYFWKHRLQHRGSPDADWFAAEGLQHELRFQALLNWLLKRAHEN